MKYKREDFGIINGSGGGFVYKIKDTSIWLKDDLTFTELDEWFYFPSKQEAEEAVAKFLAKQDMTDFDKKVMEFNEPYSNATKLEITHSGEEYTSVNIVLFKGDKLTVERKKPEKVFSLGAWVKHCVNHKVSAQFMMGFIHNAVKFDGKTIEEIKETSYIREVRLPDDWMVYPEELNK
jgi:hypothetical protein